MPSTSSERRMYVQVNKFLHSKSTIGRCSEAFRQNPSKNNFSVQRANARSFAKLRPDCLPKFDWFILNFNFKRQELGKKK